MNKTEHLEILSQIGVRPSRKLGQNFLVDPNMLNALVRAADPQENERVLEIGPGCGALTRALLEAGTKLTSVEFDHRLAEYIRTTYGDNPNFELIEADACKLDYESLFKNDTYRCIANLPYSCSSVFISLFLEAENPPEEMFVLLQREMGQRLAAEPETKNYGSLSVRTQALYDVSIVRRVPKHVFHPPPEVDSAFVKFKRSEGAPDAGVRKNLSQIAKSGFSSRRKQMLKLLASRYSSEIVRSAFRELGIKETSRAEEISIQTFIRLAEIL